MKEVMPSVRSGVVCAVTWIACFTVSITVNAADANAAFIEPAPDMGSEFRWESLPVPGGSELITLFGAAQQPLGAGQPPEIPIVSVLRDPQSTASANDHLRYVWIHGYARPSWIQHAAAALPFFYRHAEQRQKVGSGPPKPILDLAHPARGLWLKLAEIGMQNFLLDGAGVAFRATSRSYRGNADEDRALHIDQTLAALSEIDGNPQEQPAIPQRAIEVIIGRLILMSRTLGGLVGQSALPAVYRRERSQTVQNLAHNWDLLRQCAEENDLYFEPLSLPGGSTPAHALIWISREELAASRAHAFESKFLGIVNPWQDDRLLHWKGYTETRYVRDNGAWSSTPVPGSRAVQMIPLALYSLDYPKVPLLLVDFRDDWKPKYHELLRRTCFDVVRSVLGISPWSNLSWLAAETSWNFVRDRHGAAVNRAKRLRAYSRFREYLALNNSLSPALRAELRDRLRMLELNPLDNGSAHEARVAWQQYTALVRYAGDPNGLARRLHHPVIIPSGSESASQASPSAGGF